MHYLSRVHSLESLPPGLVSLFQNSEDLRQQTESLSSSVRAWNAALSEMDLESSGSIVIPKAALRKLLAHPGLSAAKQEGGE